MTTTASRTEELRRRGAIEHTAHGARELIAGSLGEDPYERIEQLREAGRRKARAEGVAYQLDHERKIVLARIASEIAQARASEKLSEAKLDRMARADARYERHIRGTAEAVQEREEANSEYWGLRSLEEWDARAVAHLNALSRLEGNG